MDAPDFQALFRIARDEMLIRNRNLTRAVVERDGTDANAVAAAAAAVGDELAGQLVRLCAGMYLDSARGTALDRLVFDIFGLVRKVASVARGSVSFTTATAVAVPFSIPVGTKLVTSDGRQFVMYESASFAYGSTGPVVAGVRSISAGTAQQAQANTIINLLDTVTGAPTNLAVTNPLATVGADDEESDDDLRSRARSYFSTLRRGTVEAIRQAALAVPGVKTATAFEVLDTYGRPAKATQLIISDNFTEAHVNIVSTSYATQSQVLAGEVFDALIDTRAAGIFVDVFVAQVILQSVTLALSFSADANIEDTALRARAAVVAWINQLSPGASLVPADIVTALQAVTGLIVTGSEVLSPSGTVVPGVLQVLRSSMALVRASTVQPDRALQGSANPDAVR